MVGSLLEGINVKRMFIAIIVMFVFVFITDFLIHGLLLGDIYKATASAWRTEEDMQGHMAWLLLAQSLVAIFFVLIFAKGYEGKGIAEGARFGLFIGPFACSHLIAQYAVTLVPLALLWWWIGGTMIQAILGGMVTAAVYRR